MARYIFQGVARDGAGNIISGATASVYLNGTTTAASVYTASSGGTAVNSVTSATDGDFLFYVDTSDYTSTQRFKISISKTGYTTNTYDDVVIFPASGTVTGYMVTGTCKNLIVKRNASNPTYQVDIDADELILTNTSYAAYMATAVNLTADISVSGANGLDTGTESANAWYYLWVISTGTVDAGLISASATSPTLPSGYTYKALVGAVYNSSGNFVAFYQRDKSCSQATSSLLSSGTETSATALTVTYVPSIAKWIGGYVSLAAGAGVSNLTATIGPEATMAYGKKVFVTDLSTGSPTIGAEFRINIQTANTIYYLIAVTGGTGALNISVTEWGF